MFLYVTKLIIFLLIFLSLIKVEPSYIFSIEFLRRYSENIGKNSGRTKKSTSIFNFFLISFFYQKHEFLWKNNSLSFSLFLLYQNILKIKCANFTRKCIYKIETEIKRKSSLMLIEKYWSAVCTRYMLQRLFRNDLNFLDFSYFVRNIVIPFARINLHVFIKALLNDAFEK